MHRAFGKQTKSETKIDVTNVTLDEVKYFRNTLGDMNTTPKPIRRKLKRKAGQYRSRNAGKNIRFLVDPERSTQCNIDDRAKKLDGAFFEGFVEIKDKQKEHVAVAARISRKREAQSSSDLLHAASPGGNIFVPPPKENGIELYKELVYTIMHRLGKKIEGGDHLTDAEIYEYAQRVLNISDQEHRMVYDEVRRLKAPECFLVVKVIAAEDVDAKDANGLSDPYCMMCVLHEGEGLKAVDNKHKTQPKRVLLRNFAKESEVKLTKIQLKTLNPVWNQTFKFSVHNLTKQKLRLDMWDKDDHNVVLDADNAITSIRGFKGAGRVLKNIYQSATSKEFLDDFMGLVEIPLNSIPENGLDAWFKLEARNCKKIVNGRIHLKLMLSTKVFKLFGLEKQQQGVDMIDTNHPQKPSLSISSQNVNDIYRQFLHLFARYECQNTVDSQPSETWDCKLVDKAEALLLQYAMQHEIRPVEEKAMKWDVYSHILRQTQVPLDVLMKLLEDYRKLSMVDKLDSEHDIQWFVRSLDAFKEYGLCLILKHRYIFSTTDPKKCIELGKYLTCLLIIYKLPLFTKQHPNSSLHRDIKATLEKSTSDWFTIEEAFHLTMKPDMDEVIRYLVNLTNSVVADLRRGMDSYNPIFNAVNIKYMVTVFNQVEVLISTLLEEKAKVVQKNFTEIDSSYNNEVAALWFELYLSVKCLYSFKTTLPESDRSKGGVDNWSNWFRRGVVRWLAVASEKAEKRIVKALEMDEVRVIDSMVKHSTSAVDITSLIGQICQFWNNLDWPDPLGAFSFLAEIVEIVGSCAMDYARRVLDQLKAKGFYDDAGKFDVTDELCIMMNNTVHVLQFLEYVPTVCQFEKVVENMRGCEGASQSDLTRSENTLVKILTCAKEDICNKLDIITVQVANKMKPTLKEFTLQIVTNPSKDVDSACEPLLEYFDSNLVTLSSALLAHGFTRMLTDIWRSFLVGLQEIAKQEKLLQGQYEKLQELIEIVRDFFYGEGNGLSDQLLDAKPYQEVKNSLDLYGSSTEKLIERYFAEQCKIQETIQENIGVITFKVFFDNLMKKLNIYVLNCFNLLPMDSTGKSDPYVTLQVEPHHLFPTMKVQRTKVQKETLYPLFDESFQFDIPPPDLLRDGVTLSLTLYDHDRLTDDDISGLVYYNLKTVPGLKTETVQGGFATVPQIQIPFMVPTLDSEPIRVMKTKRQNDSLAAHFLSLQKNRTTKLKDNVNKGRHNRDSTKR